MISKIQAVLVVVIGVVFVVSVFQCGDPYPFVERRTAHWPEYEAVLREKAGWVCYQGGVQGNYGGCDVYRGSGDDWWLVGPGRRFTRCTQDTLVETSNQVIREEYERRAKGL